MCDCEDNAPEFYTEDIVRARRDHNCCECTRTIRKGETYRRSTGKWDGDFGSYATCQACIVLWKSVTLLGCCQIFGGLHEEIHEISRYWEPEDKPRRTYSEGQRDVFSQIYGGQ